MSRRPSARPPSTAPGCRLYNCGCREKTSLTHHISTAYSLFRRSAECGRGIFRAHLRWQTSMTPAETLSLLRKARAVLERYQIDDAGIACDDAVNVCMEFDDQLDAHGDDTSNEIRRAAADLSQDAAA